MPVLRYSELINNGEPTMSHLSALELRLSNERVRLANAKTAKERELRLVWIAQIEKEIDREIEFIGRVAESDMTDDELLAALTA